MLNDESKFHIVNTDQKMMQDIRTLLIEQNKMMKLIIDKITEPSIDSKPIEIEKEVIVPKEEKNGCVRCGKVHNTHGEKLECSRKFKLGGK